MGGVPLFLASGSGIAEKPCGRLQCRRHGESWYPNAEFDGEAAADSGVGLPSVRKWGRHRFRHGLATRYDVEPLPVPAWGPPPVPMRGRCPIRCGSLPVPTRDRHPFQHGSLPGPARDRGRRAWARCPVPARGARAGVDHRRSRRALNTGHGSTRCRVLKRRCPSAPGGTGGVRSTNERRAIGARIDTNNTPWARRGVSAEAAGDSARVRPEHGRRQCDQRTPDHRRSDRREQLSVRSAWNIRGDRVRKGSA